MKEINTLHKFNNIEGYDIFYFEEYIPRSHGSNPRTFDKQIMNLKDYTNNEEWKVRNQEKAEKFFIDRIMRVDLSDFDLICRIPRSKVKKHQSHIGNIATRVSQLTEKHIATDYLVRFKDVGEAHTTGVRSYDNSINSIKIKDENLVKGKFILLLDDVTTSGNSMKACIDILQKSGAKKVVGLAMGKTRGEM